MRVGVFYHGTSASSADSIRKKGFQSDMKSDGCSVCMQTQSVLDDPDSTKFHYVTSDIRKAAAFAKMHDNPEVVRMILPIDCVKTDRLDSSKSSFVVLRNISNRLILPKKMAKFTSAKQGELEKKLSGGKECLSKVFMKTIYDTIKAEEKQDAKFVKIGSSSVSEPRLNFISKSEGGAAMPKEAVSLDGLDEVDGEDSA